MSFLLLSYLLKSILCTGSCQQDEIIFRSFVNILYQVTVSRYGKCEQGEKIQKFAKGFSGMVENRNRLCIFLISTNSFLHTLAKMGMNICYRCVSMLTGFLNNQACRFPQENFVQHEVDRLMNLNSVDIINEEICKLGDGNCKLKREYLCTVLLQK